MQPLGMLSSGGGRGSRSRKLAAAAAVQAALTRAAAEGTGGRREGAGAQEVGPPSPSGPQGARGAVAAAPPLGSVSRAAPATVAVPAEQRESGAPLRRELGRGAPAPPRRHGPPSRASTGTSRGNPRASSRPSLSDPRVLRFPLPPSYFFPAPAAATASASALRYGNGTAIPPPTRGARPPRNAEPTGERSPPRGHPEAGRRQALLPQRLRAPLASGGRAHVREGQSR